MEHIHYYKRSEAYNAINDDEWYNLDKRCMTYRVYNTIYDENDQEQPFMVYKVLHYIIDDME